MCASQVSDELLAKAFRKYPSFQKAKVVRDSRSNKSKGYGFVSFKSQEVSFHGWFNQNWMVKKVWWILFEIKLIFMELDVNLIFFKFTGYIWRISCVPAVRWTVSMSVTDQWSWERAIGRSAAWKSSARSRNRNTSSDLSECFLSNLFIQLYPSYFFLFSTSSGDLCTRQLGTWIWRGS